MDLRIWLQSEPLEVTIVGNGGMQACPEREQAGERTGCGASSRGVRLLVSVITYKTGSQYDAIRKFAPAKELMALTMMSALIQPK